MNSLFSMDAHEFYMSRAIELAKRGRGKVSPNPLVGCIIVKNGEIIGEGYHEEFGGPHAEIVALQNSQKDPVGATMYINLEPCSITGKTKPCVNALIQNSISEVYVSMLDPNPKINGNGIEELKRAGIQVNTGILKEEAERLNRAFTKWVTSRLPWVIAKVAQTSDGFMGISSDTSIWLTGEKSREHTHKLRTKVDAVLIGRNTALVDNPLLTVREVIGNNPKRIILDTNRTLPLDLNIFNDKAAQNIILCSSDKFKKSETHFCHYLPIQEKNKKLSCHNILEVLGNEGVTSILIEGGYEVLNSFNIEGLIDEMYIYTSNKKIENAKLKNPISIPGNWNLTQEISLGNDKLVIAQREELECLQEL